MENETEEIREWFNQFKISEPSFSNSVDCILAHLDEKGLSIDDFISKIKDEVKEGAKYVQNQRN